jgi:spermidine synthase
MPQSSTARSPALGSLGAGIFLTSLGVLLLEVALTRIFSFTIWYHFAYLTISVALLGFGAAGSILAAYPGLLDDPAKLLRRSCLLAGVGVIIALVVVSAVPLDPLSVLRDRAQLLNLIIYYVVVTIPFLASGFAIAGTLTIAPERVARLYFYDLVGAGLACFLVVPLIWWLGTPTTVALSTAAFAIAAIAYTSRPSARLVAAAVVVAIAGVAIGTRVDFTPGRNKFISIHMATGARPVFHRWTPINRVDAVAWDDAKQNTRTGYRDWGSSKKYDGPGLNFRMIGYDGDSCASMYRFDGDPKELEWFHHHVFKAPYVVKPEPEVLIIGVGGGTDILNAIANRAKRIVGIELNPITVELGKRDYADYNGGIFNRPEVTMIAAEGRNYLRSHSDTYDMIEINSVDTLSALSSGAYVLSESYLYTSDAVSDYLAHLKPGGVFAMAMGDFNVPGQPARHTVRLLSNVRRALLERGVTRPETHVAVIGSREGVAMAHTLVKTEPFTPEEIQRLDAFVAAEDFTFWTRPDKRVEHDAATILWADDAERDRFYDTADLNFRATTDESPFFFNFYKWTSLARHSGELDAARTFATGQIVLVIMLLQSLIFASLLILAPLLRLRGALSDVPRLIGYVLYFVALGLGFILLEISFIQRFVLYLGYPTYALSVVLFSLLSFTGLGSYFSGRIDIPERTLPRLWIALAVLSVAYLVGLPPFFGVTLGAGLAVRIAISIALLAPLGIVLGMFFPLGIRMVTEVSRQFVPWAWAINGCATVVGTILAVIAGITWDFRGVTLLALAIYGAGVAGALWARGARVSAVAEPRAAHSA